MAVFTIPTTAEISEASFSPPVGLATGDLIVTQGYYAAGDGGAAEFTVKSGTADNYFSHPINGTSGWIVDLVIRDGVVNVDQLGAKEFGINYTPFSISPDFMDINGRTDAERASKLTELNSYSVNLMSTVAGNATENANTKKNANIIAAAVANPAVHELRFTNGKLYGVQNSSANYSPIRIQPRSDFILNGRGATIQALYPYARHAITVNVSTGIRASNITIKNLNLRALSYKKVNQNDMINHGIYAQDIDNLTIQNVRIENARYGVRISGSNTNVKMERLHICNTFTGMQLTDVDGGHLVDSYISCEWNNLLDKEKAKTSHCIYATGTIKHYAFERLELRNAGYGNAVNRNAGSTPSSDLIFSNILVDRCRRAFHLGANTHNTVIKNVSATMLRYAGFQLKGVKNILFSNCLFSGDPAVMATAADTQDPLTDPESVTSAGFVIDTDTVKDTDTGIYIEDPTAYVNDIRVNSCIFDFPQRFFVINQNRYDSCSGVSFANCRFKIGYPLTSQKYTPAYIKGIVSDIRFYHCCFETDGFTTENHSGNGVFFYFSSILAYNNLTLNKMHWYFECCSFINNGTITVNSPILSQSNYDYLGTVFCSLRGCVFDGFRWTIRVATTTETGPSMQDGKINPCFTQFESNQRLAAKNALHQKGRFVSYHNVFHTAISAYASPQLIEAEQYGVDE